MNKLLSIFLFLVISSISNPAYSGDDGKINLNGKKDNGYVEVKDCFEKVNRGIFAFNQALDKVIFKPLAKGYRVFPQPIRSGTSNALSNLGNVVTIPNNVLQGQFKDAGLNSARFIINSTIGLAGFIDVAAKIGLERHEEDFGQTLGVWGVGQGPYIMLPVLGPSSLRDTLSRPVSSFLSVTFHMTETDVNIALKSIDAIETRERLLEVESLLSGDKYSFVKDAYIQSINYEVKDGIDVEDDFIDDMDDFLID